MRKIACLVAIILTIAVGLSFKKALAYDACSSTNRFVPCTWSAWGGQDYDTYIYSNTYPYGPVTIFYRANCATVDHSINNNPDIFDVHTISPTCQAQCSITKLFGTQCYGSASLYAPILEWVGVGAPAPSQLSVILDPSSGGGVASYPAGEGIYCGIDDYDICAVDFDYGTEVMLDAYPNDGWAFSHWEWNSGGSSSTNNPETFTMTEALEVTAVFKPVFMFPLQTQCSSILCTPYTASVSAVMDHSMTTPYSENNIVVAFNGEEGEKTNGYNLGCYANDESVSFDMGIEYVGTYDTGGSSYLCYDGHPGYDYPASAGTNINAPAGGTLCVATSETQQPYPADVWRNTTHCPYATAGGTSWSSYHTFYIIHEGLYINGSTNDYMTVFLHSDNLESSVRSYIEQHGYATITKNQHVAEVGDVGSPGANHMHIEVYKKNGENWERVDPYGNGISNILWR